jgi:hypothetical protein
VSGYRTQGALGRAFFVRMGCVSLSPAVARMFRGESLYYSNSLTEPDFQYYFPLAVLGAFFMYVGAKKKKAPSGTRRRSEDGHSAGGS